MSILFKRIKDWATSITAFRTGDVIPVDGPSGTAKMTKDNLLKETAQNALAGNEAPAFNPAKPDDEGGYAYYAGERVVYNGITYAFIVNKSSGSWDATKVEQVDSSEFLEKSDTLNGVARNVYGEEIDTNVFEQGNITTFGDFVAATNRVRTTDFLCVWDEMLASVPYYLKWRVIFWAKADLLTPEELVDAGTNTTWQRGTKKIIVPASATMFSIIVAKVDDSDIVPSEAEFSLVGKNNNYNKTSSILVPVGASYPVTSTTRITSKFYRVPATQKIFVDVVEGYKFRVLVYTGMTLRSKVIPFDYDSAWQGSLRSVDFSTIPGAKYFLVSLAKADDSNIDDDDFSAVKIYPRIDNPVSPASCEPIPLRIFRKGQASGLSENYYLHTPHIPVSWTKLFVSVPLTFKWKLIFLTNTSISSASYGVLETETYTYWQSGYREVSVPTNASVFYIRLTKDESSEILPSEGEVSIVGKLVCEEGFRNGLVSPHSFVVESSTRLYSKLIPVFPNTQVSVKCSSGYKWRLTTQKEYALNVDNRAYSDSYNTNWQTGPAVVSFSSPANYFVLSLAKVDDSDISVQDVNNIFFEKINFPVTSDKFFGKKISILGDSISTFGGSVSDPDNSRFAVEGDPTYPGNRCRYPQSNLVTDVNNTYWMKLINSLGLVLGINDSWAGSRVSNTSATDTGDVGPNRCISSMTRIGHLDDNGTPDIILVNAGTNDIGGNVTLGTFSYDDPSNYTDAQVAALDVSTFANAYRAMLIRLQKTYKSARIIVMLPNYTTSYYNPQKEDQYCEVVKEACDYFGVPYVDMRTAGITMFNRSSYLPDGIHYNAAGMSKIYEKIKLGFEENL